MGPSSERVEGASRSSEGLPTPPPLPGERGRVVLLTHSSSRREGSSLRALGAKPGARSAPGPGLVQLRTAAAGAVSWRSPRSSVQAVQLHRCSQVPTRPTMKRSELDRGGRGGEVGGGRLNLITSPAPGPLRLVAHDAQLHRLHNCQ
ncbi:unnamed protein product [Lampetra planeri]